MKINLIYQGPTNYYVSNICQGLSFFFFKNIQSNDFNFLTLHKN